MRWWRRGQEDTAEQQAFESQKRRLERLSGAMLDRYRAELNAEISDPERLAATYGAEFASASYRQQAQNIATQAASMMRTSFSMVTVVTPDGQESVAAHGDIDGSCPIDDSYCRHVIGTGRAFAVDDSERHALVCNTSFAREGTIISYLGVPIVRDDLIVGVLCVFDDKPREWSVGDVTILTQLAAVLTRATS